MPISSCSGLAHLRPLAHLRCCLSPIATVAATSQSNERFAMRRRLAGSAGAASESASCSAAAE